MKCKLVWILWKEDLGSTCIIVVHVTDINLLEILKRTSWFPDNLVVS